MRREEFRLPAAVRMRLRQQILLDLPLRDDRTCGVGKALALHVRRPEEGEVRVPRFVRVDVPAGRCSLG